MFLFVRHGEVHNPEQILYGRLPGYHLSDEGNRQAEAAAQFLAAEPISVAYTSPLERAVTTATIIAASHSLTPLVDERLIEVHTPFDGVTHAELQQTSFDIYSGNQAPYEQPADIRRRLSDFIRQMRSQHHGETILAVTHGDIVVALFMMLHGQAAGDIGRNRLQQLGLPEAYPATAAIHRVVYNTDDASEVPSYQYTRPYDYPVESSEL